MRQAFRAKPKYDYLIFTRDEYAHKWMYHSTVSNKDTAEGLRRSMAQHGTMAKIERRKK